MLLDKQPCVIIENEFVKPGKGQAFNRTKLKALLTGQILDKTFKSGERLDAADVMEYEVDVLYDDGTDWIFMQPDSYEQYHVSHAVVGDTKQWLHEGCRCRITLYEGAPINIEPPNTVVVEITDTQPGVKGDTVTGGTKPATVGNGAVVQIPLFVNIGDVVRVDTRTSEYLGRVNK